MTAPLGPAEAAPGRGIGLLALRWAPALIPVALGAAVGYQAAYSWTLPGLQSLTGTFLLLALGAFLLLTGIIGLAMLARSSAHHSGELVLLVVGLTVAGAAGGGASVGAFNLGYHPPVVLQASGTASLTLDAQGFAPVQASLTSCDSAPDATSVGVVTALDLGQLNQGTVRAFLRPADPGPDQVELFIDGADLPPGTMQPHWNGPSHMTAGTDARSGTITFDGLALQSDSKDGTALTGWPPTVSGSVAWQCAAWGAASPPPAAGGGEGAKGWPATLQMTLDGVDVRQAVGGHGACTQEGSGAIGVVSGTAVLLIQGQPFDIEIDVGGRQHPGGTMHVAVRMNGKNPPAGLVFKPNWDGNADLTKLDPGGRGGTLTMTGLPTGVDPQNGPAPTGWPTVLTGSLSWTCG